MSPPDHQPSEPGASIRMDARLDSTTRQKVDDLAKHLHQSPAAVVGHIMHWALSREQPETRDGGASEDPVRHLSLFVDTALHAQVEKVTAAARMNIAPWLRSMVCQITITDFPASWQEAIFAEWSHDSRTILSASCYGRMHPQRRSFSNASRSLVPRKLKSSASSSCQHSWKIFPKSWHIESRTALHATDSAVDEE